MGFHSAERLRTHRITCEFCPKCERFVEKRHLDKCEGKKFKAVRFRCPKCFRFRAKSGMRQHMLVKHKTPDFIVEEHSECISEVKKWCFFILWGKSGFFNAGYVF